MRLSRSRKIRLYKIGGILITSIIVLLYTLAAFKKKVQPLYANGVVEAPVGDIQYDFSTGMFTFTDNKLVYLKGLVSETLRSTSALSCNKKDLGKDNLCLMWLRYAKLEVKKDSASKDNCHKISWTATSRDFTPNDCFALRGPDWFGGSLLSSQHIPLQYADVPMQPYITNDILFKTKVENHQNNVYGNVVERFWINSNGVGIVVDSSVPLHVSLNETGSNMLCFKGDYTDSPFPNPNNEPPSLTYTICKKENIREIRHLLQKQHFDLPQGIPDLSVMQKVTWSTKGRYKANLNQKNVLDFASEIHKKLDTDQTKTPANFEIYEPYSSEYGNFDFKIDSFSNSQQMVGIVRHEFKFNISAALTPFISVNTKNFDKYSNLLIHDTGGKAPMLTRWLGGLSGIVDLTNSETRKWFQKNLEDMKTSFNLDSFTYHGCETNFIPSSHKSHQFLRNPCTFIDNFVSTVLKFGNQVTCGHRTQKYPAYIHLSSRDSTWGHKNGLNSIIPAVLTLGILGYPFIIPDVIGGSGYKGDNLTETTLPDRELYIRWLQLATFLPVMKFSIPPWDFDDEMVTITKDLLKTRETVLPILLKTARETEHTGAPIIRPIWWNIPTDREALAVGNQFLVGDSLMVSPVLSPGTTNIDIYLPDGEWLDTINGKVYHGQQWLKSYSVALNQIPTFRRPKNLGSN